MNRISLLQKILLSFTAVLLFSCDKDFNTVGSDLVGEENYTLEKYVGQTLEAYNKATGGVQTNNLPVNLLGVMNNTTFGETKAHFVSEVQLASAAPTIGDNPVIDSVWVYVPYFATQTGTDDNGVRLYELDSVYGKDNKFSLKVFESKYQLRTFDPANGGDAQKYFSDEKNLVENNKGTLQLNDGPPNQNTQFYFNNLETILYKLDADGNYLNSAGQIIDNNDVGNRVVLERFAPGVWLDLNKAFFQNKILNASSDKLLNNNAFKEYFRGLYFQVESVEGKTAMAMLDFSKAKINIRYKADASAGSTSRVRKSIVLNLTGTTVNFLENSFALPSESGDERLYLKGGQGSFSYIDLFNKTELEDLRAKVEANKWLINEANLTFYVDKQAMQNVAYEPQRIYLYDMKNNKVLIDYNYDPTTNSYFPKMSKVVIGGLVERETSGDKKAIKYKLRLTQYVNNLIKKDSSNVRVGLVVTEDINNVKSAYLKNPFVMSDPMSPVGTSYNVKFLPVASVINPLGTVLHGTNSADVDKRLKLEIYYTKPKE
ncbi:DUF4270 domain-containing protein [Flavobacterium supellecticarium]|uniref:DUF4270 domain-containing protein n=1 Tax=Flavobacterium supellecticarium TaxID=2565924 RepID=A0A4S3ZRU0_9FLAO|nr:DUF4270 domain-containing protein [Flavobacterium supellecticarium]THF48227.1 DUF4270 domain-containing protein [Flavobacterium supellecticarium]